MITPRDLERAPATEEKIVELEQYNRRPELSPVDETDYWYFGDNHYE